MSYVVQKELEVEFADRGSSRTSKNGDPLWKKHYWNLDFSEWILQRIINARRESFGVGKLVKQSKAMKKEALPLILIQIIGTSEF